MNIKVNSLSEKITIQALFFHLYHISPNFGHTIPVITNYLSHIMNTEDANRGSRLIKDLMGSTIKIDQDDVKDIPLAFLAVEDMKFHLSWKWMMPVVIKIEEELDYPVLIKGKKCQIDTSDNVFEHEEDTKLMAIWNTIVDFLEWHKENG